MVAGRTSSGTSSLRSYARFGHQGPHQDHTLITTKYAP
ncbi:hypothetical protein KPATCC21470_8555 [Kitasatospora purpeofusca]